MSSDPNYLQNLQVQSNNEALTRLHTLAFEYDSLLSRFQAARKEMQRFLKPTEGVCLSILVPVVQAQLEALSGLDVCFAHEGARPSGDKLGELMERLTRHTSLRTAPQVLADFPTQVQNIRAKFLELDIFVLIRDELIQLCTGLQSSVFEAITRLEDVCKWPKGDDRLKWKNYRNTVYSVNFSDLQNKVPISLDQLRPYSSNGAAIIESATQKVKQFNLAATSLISHLKQFGYAPDVDCDLICEFITFESSRFISKAERLRNHFLGEADAS
jgi:hypothetical protein